MAASPQTLEVQLAMLEPEMYQAFDIAFMCSLTSQVISGLHLACFFAQVWAFARDGFVIGFQYLRRLDDVAQCPIIASEHKVNCARL